jgi:hypothetical protein
MAPNFSHFPVSKGCPPFSYYNHKRPHTFLADQTPAAFAELHRRVTEKTSTSMGRAVQSLFIESLDRAQPASNQEILTVEAEKL